MYCLAHCSGSQPHQFAVSLSLGVQSFPFLFRVTLSTAVSALLHFSVEERASVFCHDRIRAGMAGTHCPCWVCSVCCGLWLNQARGLPVGGRVSPLLRLFFPPSPLSWDVPVSCAEAAQLSAMCTEGGAVPYSLRKGLVGKKKERAGRVVTSSN